MVMKRISEHISRSLSTVECPACHHQVNLSTVADDTGSSTAGGRWSFIWVAPRGPVCPNCQFPLARYMRRLAWIRLFMTGVALLAVSLMLFILSLIGGPRSWLGWSMRIMAGLGGLLAMLGLIGIIVGGQRDSTKAEPR